MHILQISWHSPENCAMFNEKSKNMTLNLLKNMDGLLAKHGVKLLSSWNDMAAHEIYSIYETPNMEAFLGLLNEPVMMAWLGFHKVTNKVVFGLPEVKAIMGLGK